jgi:methionine synthase I (cobalamin-dependent)
VDLLDELENRIVCGDGAMGTLLLDRGLPVKMLNAMLAQAFRV